MFGGDRTLLAVRIEDGQPEARLPEPWRDQNRLARALGVKRIAGPVGCNVGSGGGALQADQANGTRDEHDLLVRLDRLGGRDSQGLGRNRLIGCVAITEPIFFAPDEWVAVPSDWARNIVSGRTEDLSRGEGLRMWSERRHPRHAMREDVPPARTSRTHRSRCAVS